MSRPIHPFAQAIKEISSIYEDDEFEFITDMYHCRYVKTVLPFFVYYFDYVYNNEFTRNDRNSDGFLTTPLMYTCYDPIFLKFNAKPILRHEAQDYDDDEQKYDDWLYSESGPYGPNGYDNDSDY